MYIAYKFLKEDILKISLFTCFVLAAFILCSCGDDNHSNVVSYDIDISSSSEIVESSDSLTSSSSLQKSSSSSKNYSSSSSVKLSSSSVMSSSSSLPISSSSNLSLSSSELSSSSSSASVSSSSSLLLSSSSSITLSSSSLLFSSSSLTKSSSSLVSSSSSLPKSSSSVAKSSSSSAKSSSSDSYKYEYIEDSRDGKQYKVLTFGEKRWMVENLAFDYQYLGVEKRYAKEADSIEFFGRTYLWSEALDSSAIYSTTGKDCGYNKPKCSPCGARGICPSGWHVPNLSEWFDLLENGDEDKLEKIWGKGNRVNYYWVTNEYGDSQAYTIKPKANRSYELAHRNKSTTWYVRCVEDDAAGNDAMCKINWPKDDVNKGSVYDDYAEVLTDERDGNKYRTVEIGDQIWMAENLRYAYLQPTSKLDSSSFCHKHVASNCKSYGRYYLWSAALDSAGVFSKDGVGCGYNWKSCNPQKYTRGVCPAGWHIPSAEEWNTLIEFVGGSKFGGRDLKAVGSWEGKRQATDKYNFSVIPVRAYVTKPNGGSDSFENYGYQANFVSSTVHENKIYSYGMTMFYTDDVVEVDRMLNSNAISVRCLKNPD